LFWDSSAASAANAIVDSVRSIVDPTVIGLGRYIPRIQRVADQVSDLHIVVATGCYTYHDVPFFFHHRTPAVGALLGREEPEPMVPLFVSDITEGIAGTGVRAGMLKCAIRCADPVIFIESKVLYGRQGDVPEGEYTTPLEGAQVVLEAIGEGKKEVNPHGLAFFSAQTTTSENPLDAVAPLAAQSLAALRQAVQAAGSEPSDVVRVTCFLSSLDNLAATRKLVEAEYPRAALNYVETQRAPARALVACEAVARLRREAGARLLLMNPEGLPREPGESQIALVSAPHVVLTGSQVSFGYQEEDARLAFDRLRKSLEQSGVSARDVAFAHYYPLSAGIAEQVRRVRARFFDDAHPPAGSLVLFEGLPSMEAGFAVDVVAVKD